MIIPNPIEPGKPDAHASHSLESQVFRRARRRETDIPAGPDDRAIGLSRNVALAVARHAATDCDVACLRNCGSDHLLRLCGSHSECRTRICKTCGNTLESTVGAGLELTRS